MKGEKKLKLNKTTLNFTVVKQSIGVQTSMLFVGLKNSRKDARFYFARIYLGTNAGVKMAKKIIAVTVSLVLDLGRATRFQGSLTVFVF